MTSIIQMGGSKVKLNSKFVRRLGVAVGLAMVVAACGSEQDPAASDAAPVPSESSAPPFYEGKTISLIVPFGAGGGTDTAARIIAGPLSQFIPGNPLIQVINIAGGDSVVGANQFARLNPDGLTIMMSSASTAFPYIFGAESAVYDFADFVAIAGLPAGAVQYVSGATGVGSIDDFYETESPLIYGGVQPGGGELSRLIGFAALEANVRPVFGYSSRGEIRRAWEQGETELDGSTSQAYLRHIAPMVEAGQAFPLYTNGLTVDGQLVRDPAFPDLPHAGELYEARFGRPATGELWEAYTYLVTLGNTLQKPFWIRNDAPAEAIAALEEGFAAFASSDLYRDEILPEVGYGLIVGDSLRAETDRLVNFDAGLVAFLKSWVKEVYDQEL